MTSASALASSVWRPLAKRAARRYIAGESPDDAVTVCRELADGGLSSTVGFWNRSDDSPDDVTQRCIEALNAIGAGGKASTSLSLKTPAPLDPEKFLPWVNELSTTEGPKILRLKGILSFKDDPQRFVIQGVHMVLDGDHQREEIAESVAGKDTGKRRGRRCRSQAQDGHPVPVAVGHPAPEVGAEDAHDLHQRHEGADLGRGHALVGEIQAGIRRKDADVAVIRKEEQGKAEGLPRPG